MDKRGKISAYRWVILITTVPVIIATEMMWLSLAPVSSMAEDYYHVDSFIITLFTMSYMLMFILFAIPSAMIIDRFGYRKSLIIGALLTGIFAMTRGIFSDNLSILMISQFLIAIGQPFLLNITTKIAATWFPLHQRSTAAGILTMAQYLGFAIPMALSPLLTEKVGLHQMLLILGIIAFCASAISLVFSKENPYQKAEDCEKQSISLKGMTQLRYNKEYMKTLIIAFVSIGIFNTILTLIETILLSRGITSEQAGMIGATFVLAGVVGAVILPIISDKTKKRTVFIVASLIALVPLYLGLSMLVGYASLLVVAFLAGFLIMGVAPILFQHGSEVAIPIKEGTSLGTILLMGQISGILFVLIFEGVMSFFDNVLFAMILLVLFTGLEIPLAITMKESKMINRVKNDV